MPEMPVVKRNGDVDDDDDYDYDVVGEICLNSRQVTTKSRQCQNGTHCIYNSRRKTTENCNFSNMPVIYIGNIENQRNPPNIISN